MSSNHATRPFLDGVSRTEYHKDRQHQPGTLTTEQRKLSDVAAPNKVRKKKRKQYRVTVTASESPYGDAELYRTVIDCIRALTAGEQRKG